MEKRIEWESYSHKFITNEDVDENEDEVKPILQTPFGMFRVDDTLNPFRQFNFWIGNTNFNLSKKHKFILDTKIEGIEVLSFLTRYKFIIGIGKMFSESEIKQNIEEALCQSEDIKVPQLQITTQKENNDLIVATYKKLDSIYKYWIVYVFPNGNLDYFGNPDIVKVMEKHTLYKQAQIYSYGHIIISNEFSSKLIKNESNNKPRI